MTRQEFLRYAGGGLLVLFGFNNLISYLRHSAKVVQLQPDGQQGFGSRKFGA